MHEHELARDSLMKRSRDEPFDLRFQRFGHEAVYPRRSVHLRVRCSLRFACGNPRHYVTTRTNES